MNPNYQHPSRLCPAKGPLVAEYHKLQFSEFEFAYDYTSTSKLLSVLIRLELSINVRKLMTYTSFDRTCNRICFLHGLLLKANN